MTLSRWAAILTTTLVTLVAIGFAFAEDKATLTVEGEVVDQGCFLRNDARGPDHQECAARCLKNGNPAGIVTDDGELYTLAASASAFETFAAKRVRITGASLDRTIFPKSMELWENDAWTDVPLTKFGGPETK